MTYALTIAASLALAWLAATPTANGGWTKMGPGAGGAFTQAAAGPTGIVLAGSDIGGLYRSLDGGGTWDGIGTDRGVPLTHVSAVAFDAADPSLMWCGGNASRSDRSTLAALYRSTDFGATWMAAKPAMGGYVSAFAVARDVMYCAWAPAYNAPDQEIWRSGDRGATWIKATAKPVAGRRAIKLLVHPVNTRCLLMVTGDDGNIATPGELWQSSDGAVTWSRIGKVIGPVLDVAWHPAKPETLVASTDVSGVATGGFVWRSLNGGTTWTQAAAYTGALAWKAGSDTVRVVNVAKNITITGKTCGTFESGDAGATWKRKASGNDWDTGWVGALAPAYGRGSYGIGKTLGGSLKNPNEIWWVTSRFLWKSTSGGLRFDNAFTRGSPGDRWLTRGVDNINIFTIAASEMTRGKLYAGYFDLGLWRSLDGGGSWRMLNDPVATGTWKGRGGNASSVLLDPARPDVIWTTNGVNRSKQRLIRSARSGDPGTWTAATGLVDDAFMIGLSLDRQSPVNRRTLFVTSAGDVYKSIDDGVTFARVLDATNVFVTAVDRFDGRLVYAGGADGFFVSIDGGRKWNGPLTQAGTLSGTVPKPENVGEAQWTGVHAIVPDPVTHDRVWVVAYSTAGVKSGLWMCANPRAPKPTLTQKASRHFARGFTLDPKHPGRAYLTTSPAANSGKAGVDTTLTFGLETTEQIDAAQPAWTSLNRGKQWRFAWPVVVDPFDSTVVYVGEPGNGALKLTRR
ncbi:MAG TPA: hypothetical protein VJY35_05065 [Candidatus Eisenbacteria bacterium]|nr:hypothetical protein [Candidatus Eisenbacteria bacterium]